MEIEDIRLEKIYTGSLQSSDMDGVKHMKELPLLSVVEALEGEYEIQLGNGAAHHTGVGGFFIAPSRILQTITHHADSQSGQMRARWVFLEIVMNRTYLFESLFQLPVLIPLQERQDFHSVLDDIFQNPHPCDRMINGYRLIQRLIHIAKPEKLNSRIDFSMIERFISAHYAQKITVSNLAQLLHMSQSNFYLVFKKTFGLSPMVYLNNYRLSVASLLLHDPALSMQEIAERSGFYDQFYFSRCFKKMFGVSPSQYRTDMRLPQGESERIETD